MTIFLQLLPAVASACFTGDDFSRAAHGSGHCKVGLAGDLSPRPVPGSGTRMAGIAGDVSPHRVYGSGQCAARFAGDDIPHLSDSGSGMFKADFAGDDLLRSGMCKAGFAGAPRGLQDGSGISERPKNPGAMNGGVSMVPSITDGTNLMVGSASNTPIELFRLQAVNVQGCLEHEISPCSVTCSCHKGV